MGNLTALKVKNAKPGDKLADGDGLRFRAMRLLRQKDQNHRQVSEQEGDKSRAARESGISSRNTVGTMRGGGRRFGHKPAAMEVQCSSGCQPAWSKYSPY